MVNTRLMNRVSIQRLIELGFTQHHDGSGHPAGYWWEITNTRYSVVVDPWYEIRLYQIQPDSDGVMLFAENEYELQEIIDFVNIAGASVPLINFFDGEPISDDDKKKLEESLKNMNNHPVFIRQATEVEIKNISLNDTMIKNRLAMKRMTELLQGVHDSFKDEFTGNNRQVDALNDVAEYLRTKPAKTDEK